MAGAAVLVGDGGKGDAQAAAAEGAGALGEVGRDDGGGGGEVGRAVAGAPGRKRGPVVRVDFLGRGRDGVAGVVDGFAQRFGEAALGEVGEFWGKRLAGDADQAGGGAPRGLVHGARDHRHRRHHEWLAGAGADNGRELSLINMVAGPCSPVRLRGRRDLGP